jgi:8-oxo-dGTP diphosphatase
MPRTLKPPAPRRLMVLAAVIRKRGRILIARRKATDRFGGRWEFPGGKIEPGETSEGCLERELMEEFGIKAGIGRFIGSVTADPAGLAIRLDAYEAVHQAGEFELREHDEIRWVWPSELAGFELTEPDRRLLDRILQKRDEKQR